MSTPMRTVVAGALRALGGVRQRILDHVREVNATTEAGTLAAGRQLDRVVAVARATIARLGKTLACGSTKDGELVQSIRQLSENARRHNQAMLTAVTRNLGQVAVVAEQLKTITTAARQVELLNAAARVLSINARIEANRQSGGANAFKAIAAEMQGLSRAISAANTQITELAAAMELTLPLLEREGHGLVEMVDEFAKTARAQIANVDHQVGELQATVKARLAESDEALVQIVAASYAGLSELGFQDVCAQKLRLIDRQLGDAHRDVALCLGVTEDQLESKPAAYVTVGDGTTRTSEAGEVLLF